MKNINKPITDIVLDFDGTCTQIPIINEGYLKQCLKIFNDTVLPLTSEDWQKAQQQVQQNSPKAGWMLGGCPSAPAAADPYILAYETANHILRKRNIKNPLPDIHSKSVEANQAPWRSEARDVFEGLLKKNIKLHFISNSNSLKITQRLLDLFGVAVLPHGISVNSDARKYCICELSWDAEKPIPDIIRKQFMDLSASIASSLISSLERPVYLRRGAYFETIYSVFKEDWSKLGTTIFCGDIWEMDLAMPFELGASIHLIERASPYETYSYEREIIKKCDKRAKISSNLSGLLEWI